MDKLCDPANLNKFCKHIVRAIETKNNIDLLNLITILKVIISGPPGERCQSFYIEKLSAERCVVAGLRAKSTREALTSDPETCAKMMSLLLSLPYLSDELVKAIGFLAMCVESLEVNLRKTFASLVLNHKDLKKFDLKTIAFCLEEDRSILETILLNLCVNTEESDCCFENHWMEWSSGSSRIFQTMSGILNELFIRLKCKRKVVAVIDSFIRQMTSFCFKNSVDFPSLYPYDVQGLIGILMLDPNDVDFPEFQNEVSRRFATILNSDVSLALILSTHFPKWNRFFFK